MELGGWIKLHRKLINDPIFQNAELLQLFIYCLLKANYKSQEFLHGVQIVKINRGQFLTGRKVLANALKQKETTVRKRLHILQKLGYVTIESNNKFSIVSIINYSIYQHKEIIEEQQEDNKLTTEEQRRNTNKNDKEFTKKIKKRSFEFSEIIFPENLNNEVFKTTYQKWYDYLKEKTKKLTRIGTDEQLKFLAENSKDALKIIERSIANGWQGLFPLPLNYNQNGIGKNGQSNQQRKAANSL